MITIYFNQWFNTVLEHFEYLRKDFSEIRIIGSGKSDNSYMYKCDEFFVEPKFNNIEDRIKFYLDICKKEKVDFFFSYKWLEEINEYRKDFEEIGTTLVIPENHELLKILNNKVDSAEYFQGLNIEKFKVPETIPCNTFSEFISAFSSLKSKYKDVCVKYSEDVGGSSYHKIVDKKTWTSLYSDHARRITIDEIKEYFENKKDNKTLILMPYLNGEEISVDCVQTKDKFIGVSRRKLGNIQELKTSGFEIEIAEKISEELKLETPFNIQFRYLDGIPYFLEVNTRLSGGSFMCKHLGINFLSIYLKERLEMDNEVKFINNEIHLSKVDTAIVRK